MWSLIFPKIYLVLNFCCCLLFLKKVPLKSKWLASSFTYSVYYLSEKRSLLHIFIINPFSSCKVPVFYMAYPKLRSNIKIHSVRCDWWFWGDPANPSHHHHHPHQHLVGLNKWQSLTLLTQKPGPTSHAKMSEENKNNYCQKANSWDLYTLWRPRLLKHISTLLKQHIRTHWVVNANKINTNINTVKCKSSFICLKCTVCCDVICLHTN